MSILADIRREYPEFRDMSDRELSDVLRKKYYSDVPKDQFQKQISTSVSFPETKYIPPSAIPAAAPKAAPTPKAAAQSAGLPALKEVKPAGIFDYFTNREEAIKQDREYRTYLQERQQREYMEDIKTNTGFMDFMGDLVSSGMLSIRSGVKDVEALIEQDPALKKKFQEEARRYAKNANTEVAGSLTTEDVKENWLKAVPFALQEFTRSAPSLAVMPLGALGLAGGVARGRAEADGREDISAGDLAVAAPVAVVSTILDRFGIGELIGAAGKTAVIRTLKAGAAEGGTEAIQSTIEYLGSRVGTEQGADAREAFEQAMWGAIIGGTAGGTLRGTGELATAPFRRGAKPETETVDPTVNAEFQRLAAIEVANVMAANPEMGQNDAVKLVSERAEELFNIAAANIVAPTKGGTSGAATTGAGMDVSGAGGAGIAPDLQPTPTAGGTAIVGGPNTGRLGKPVPSVPILDVGTATGERPLAPITGAQVKATVPIIEQAFEAAAIDFEDSYGVKKLNAEQKKQAARIVLQSPEVDPYDAIGSVLDRGAQLRGEKVPSTSRTTVTGPANAGKLQADLSERLAAIQTKADEERAAIQAQPTPTVAETITEEKVATPATKTLNDLAGIGTVNPENTNEVLVEGGGIQLTPLADNILKVDSLRAVETGGGRKAMEQLVQVADSNGTELQLSPEPFAAEAGKEMSPTELGEWYRGFGFQEQPDGSMVRPAPTSPSTITPSPREYTAQEIAENLDRFAMSEAQDRGLDPSMFREGARDVQDGREFLKDEQLKPEHVEPYKAGIQWAQDRITEAQAATVDTVAVEEKKQFLKRMKKAPGKTARQKLFAIMNEDAKKEAEANPPEEVSELDPELEEIEGKAGLNKKRLLEAQRAKYKGDPRSMTGVVAKELLQNSHDATRTAMENGQITRGKVDFNVSNEGRTITLHDNGIGMTGNLLAGPFLELGSTGKGEGTGKNSGGFGLAKALLLYGSDKIDVMTASGGKISTLDTTGEALAAAAIDEGPQPRIKVRDFTPEDYKLFPDGHGTIVQLLMPEEDVDPEYGKVIKVDQLPTFYDDFEVLLRGLRKSPLFANTDVTYNNATVPIGANFALQDYRVFARVKLPYGVAHIYVSKEKQQYGNYNNVHILSDGVWQFDTEIKDNNRKNLPYEIYINIVPYTHIKPDSAIYPFNEQRKNFSDSGAKAHQKLANLIRATYGVDTYAESVKSFGSIQYFDPNTRTLGPVIDLTPEIPQDVLDKLSGIGVADDSEIEIGNDGRVKVNGDEVDTDSVEDLENALPRTSQLIIDQSKIDAKGVMVHENADVEYINAEGKRERKPMMEFLRETFGTKVDDFYYYMGDAFQQLRGEVVNIMGPSYAKLDTEAVGISVDPGYRGVSIKLPFSGMFINPLVPEAPAGPQALFGIITTMVHELAHFKVRSHDAGFPAEMQRIQAALEAAIYEQGFDFATWKQRFVDRAIDAGYVDIIRAGQQLFETEKDRESYTYGNPDYKNIRVIYRGERFKDGASEQVPVEGEAGPDGTANNGELGGGTGTEERLLGPTYESRKGAGKGRESGAGEGGGEPLTDANVEKAVSVKLSKGQIKRLEQAAGIRRMELNNMQKRIVKSRNDNETNSLIKRLVAAAHDPDANSGILASLTRSLPPPVYKFLLGFQQIEDVFRLAKVAGLKSLAKIDTIMREEYIPYVNRIVRSAGKISDDWSEFASRDPKGNAALDDTIIYSNMFDMDPSLALTAADYMRIDPKLQELQGKLAAETDPKKQSALKGQITTRKGEIQRGYFGGTGEDEAGNPVTVAGWNSVPPEGRRIFKAARDFHRASFNEHYRLLMQRIDDAKFDSNDAVKLKSSVENMFAKARERIIYFPVKRFGEYWLSVGSDFYMRESAAELAALQRRLKKEGETRDMTPGYSRGTLRNVVANKDASAALKGILDILDGSNTTNANGKAKIDDVEDLRDLIFQMYLTALPEADMRRRFVHREFKTGFSTDSLRSFASTAVASANQLGRLAYNYKFQNEIESAKKETETKEMKPWLDTLTLEVKDRVDNIMSPDTNNIIDTIIAFGSKVAFYHHLSSAGSALINFTQLHIVGLPVLSGEFGEAKTAAMATRYTTSFLVGREIPNPLRDDEGNWALQAPEFQFQNSGYMRSLKKSDPERYKQTMAAWEYAQDHDVIESTFSSNADLYARSNAPTGDFNFRQAVRRGEGLTAAKRATANTINAMGYMFHMSEVIGRSIMYMSSFDLAYERAIKQGKTAEEAGKESRELAVTLTNKGMFDFSNWNKSRFAKYPGTRLALQMTSYIQSMNSLMFRSILGMIPYYNKEGKAAAARVLFGTAGVTMLYGGLTATQFYAWGMAAYTLTQWIASLFEDDDEEEEAKQGYLNEKTIERELLKYADEHENELGRKDMEYYIRGTWIPETFGIGSTMQSAFGLSDKAAANLATAADMGIPGIFGVDISNSVALGDLWSPVKVKGDTPEVRAYEAVARTALGPFGSAGISYIKGADAYNNGDIQQAVELIVPAVIRNPLKGQRLKEEGLKIGKDKDIQLKDPSYYTPAKVVLQSLGLKDAQTSRNMQLDIMAGDIEKGVAAEKTKLLDERYRAIIAFERDPSDKNEQKWNAADRAIDVYNLNYPSNAITSDTKEKSLKNKRVDAADKAYGLGVNQNIPVRESLQEERINQILEEER